MKKKRQVLHLVRSIYPDIPAVFVDTGLEYPEIKEFVKTIDNVIILRPRMSFNKMENKNWEKGDDLEKAEDCIDTICPRCNRKITIYPALSRRDNKTYICSQCGTDKYILMKIPKTI